MDIYTIYGGEGSWETVGGTSLAAPLIAGMWAVVGGASGLQHPVQRLYENNAKRPGSYYDVVTGSNGFCGASDATITKLTCSTALWASAGTGSPNNLAFRNGRWTGVLDCGWVFYGKPATLSDDRQCRAGVGYDGPSGIGTPRSLQLFQPTTPTAALAAHPDTPVPGSVSVSLVAHVTGLGDTLKQCSVSWGDGPAQAVSCSAGSASHAYAAAGAYRVTYTVIDAYGQQISAPSQLVTVGAGS
jgi:hypothetical protein